MQYKDVIEIDGKKLTRPYLAKLNKEERIALIEPMFQYFRNLGWMLPDFEPDKLKESYKKLVDYVPDTSLNETYNNVSMATDICQYFCRKSYYGTTDRKNGKVQPTMHDNFLDDDKLRKICHNRLGLQWYDTEPGETFNITPKMVMYQAQRSMRMVSAISFFKPSVAKMIYMRYTKEGDTVYDYSCGFGARALGALSCNRKYVGVDPLTVPEILEMLDFLQIDNSKYSIKQCCSEHYKEYGEESVDFAFSSPPYYDQEYYSMDKTQAYNAGEDYFYNVYWKNTLDNCQYMLKNGALFGLNITEKYSRMIEMCNEFFGKPVDVFKLRLVKSHLHKSEGASIDKHEPVFIWRKG